jgi:hypothetical protein
MLILIDGTVKTQFEPGQEKTGDTPLLSHYSLLRHSLPKSTGVLEHCCEGETTVGFSIFRGVYGTSVRITKATKDVNVHFYIRSSNSCKLYHRIP